MPSKANIEWGIVLAAGFGSRLKPLTEEIPKSLIKVCDITLLDHAIGNLIEIGITNIAVNGHYKADMILDHIKRKWQQVGINIQFVFEPSILETGGGVMNIMTMFNIKRAVVCNSDTLIFGAFEPALSVLLEKNTDESKLLLLVQHFTKSHQDFTKGDLYLTDDNHFIFNKENRGPYIFIGSYIVDYEIFADQSCIKPFSMLHYIAQCTKESTNEYPYFAVEFDGVILNIDSLEKLKLARYFLELHPELMRKNNPSK